MDELKYLAGKYHHGMITAKEFLGQATDIIGRAWLIVDTDDGSKQLANDLAERLTNREG